MTNQDFVTSPAAEKKLLRREYLSQRRNIPKDIKKELDSVICENIKRSASYRYADTILLYAPIEKNGEVDVLPLLSAAISSGKRVAFPRCNPETSSMSFYFVSSVDELYLGAYNILEPSENAPMLNPSESSSSVCLVPAVLFDSGGFRVGYGKGYYDRFFSHSGFCGSSIGVSYSDFVVDRVPRGRFDISVSAIITEKGVLITSAK